MPIQLRNLILQTPTYLTMLVGVLLISYQYGVGPLPLLVQFVVCLLLLLAAGIPHGALDHLIEQRRSAQANRPFSMGWFILKYLLLIAAYGVGWLVSPVGSLVVFLVISAWHFGETDLENAPATVLWSLARFVCGGWVLAFILLTHWQEVNPIIARIVQGDPYTIQVWTYLTRHTAAVMTGITALLMTLIGLSYWQRPIAINGGRLLRLGVILLLTYPLPLLPAFILYFAGWHALSSFGSIRAYLSLPGSSLHSAWHLWWQAMPLTVAAFLFLGTCTIAWKIYVPTLDPIPTLFIVLSTITLPHIQVMHQLNNKYK
ncbi:Brp/Blh family beta-carotene 15,15'-dioxygenase [Fibrivirga algicola]|uniref:Probable beta-carotene 15,15'-dioxygenase n=1 Tax=Fibrivirga algicola TaxID=2950420 RepID=A0ABX0QBT3_9BACT|nr:Brp/Blh family beta-carotene 15,15'-dioxygenase [Fibrivirga algicola]NID09820.1 hypothetical protein [Fibrivirga algicola]